MAKYRRLAADSWPNRGQVCLESPQFRKQLGQLLAKYASNPDGQCQMHGQVIFVSASYSLMKSLTGIGQLRVDERRAPGGEWPNDGQLGWPTSGHPTMCELASVQLLPASTCTDID